MKLVEVMACVDRVAKNGNNTAQGYKYAQAADVYDAVRSELAKRFVLMVPHLQKVEWSDVPTKSGGTLKLCTVHVRFDFIDAETGEVMPVEAFGQGSDSGDKAGYKAMTGATKSCLVQTFLIPTGDDPENEKGAKPAPPPPAGADALKARMKAATPSAPNIASAAQRAADEPPPHTDADFHLTSEAPPPAAHVPTSPPTHNRERSFRFGNAKDRQLHELEAGDLKFYKGALERDLASDDPKKQRYADSNRAALADVAAELKYRGL